MDPLGGLGGSVFVLCREAGGFGAWDRKEKEIWPIVEGGGLFFFLFFFFSEQYKPLSWQCYCMGFMPTRLASLSVQEIHSPYQFLHFLHSRYTS